MPHDTCDVCGGMKKHPQVILADGMLSYMCCDWFHAAVFYNIRIFNDLGDNTDDPNLYLGNSK